MMEMSNETKPTSTPPEYSGPAYSLPQVQYPQYGAAIPVLANPPPPIIWMPPQPQIPKCPRGLEYFSQLDQITVEQQIELMEMISGFETCNKYEVKNAMGHWIYFAAEENDDFNLNCYGPLRSFTIKLFDSTNQPVMQLSREFHCSSCCCPCICCLQELEVQAPLGNIIGYVKQNWHPCLPKFTIQNEARENVLKITSPCVACQCYQDVNFEVKTVDGKSTIGNIVKKWTGLAREVATDASIFQIHFPMDLDINMKAVIMGASFLMDFMFFENAGNRGNNRNRSNN
ncbi:phospholipid scramblase 1-like isoform X1 [Thamnophis elegans]|uniref:phospholipid scramblase 1-like isoform X1 n=1 Tax=Thamnophis elegans TaxID=35005 RepID=UPI001376AF36|nr:phospholipid scramblase 1-like isoform X1 [Thamnophis elegans]XP_032081082.1 phospholipid scramblase 1-like isoform X1 [Thamnophis elegans]XP_032081083.1 phospholipid scramblase 1-like isoform X1 [Thamnophis elegans]